MKGTLYGNMKCTAGMPHLQVLCYSPADEYVIYGCLNQHISETSLCSDHAMVWLNVQDKYKHQCPQCNSFIEEYLAIRIYNGQ